jgi:hypothetical protein
VTADDKPTSISWIVFATLWVATALFLIVAEWFSP